MTTFATRRLLPSVPLYVGNLFSWFTGKGTVEASTLGRAQPWTRLWADACDVGFQIKSPKTGQVRVFTMTREVRDNEGEVTHWEFASCDDPTSAVDITVFNE